MIGMLFPRILEMKENLRGSHSPFHFFFKYIDEQNETQTSPRPPCLLVTETEL